MSDCPVCCGIEGYAIHTCEKAVAKYTPEASDLATNVRSYEDRIADLEAQLAAEREKYSDLIMQVQNKIPGESRHETARRIIQQHENQCNEPQATAQEEP
jgi:uncharacterized protein YhaN